MIPMRMYELSIEERAFLDRACAINGKYDRSELVMWHTVEPYLSHKITMSMTDGELNEYFRKQNTKPGMLF